MSSKSKNRGAGTGAEVVIRHRVLVLRVAQEFKPGMRAGEVYEIVRGVWRIAEDLRDKTVGAFALAVHQGVVHGVFCIDGWTPAAAEDYRTAKYDPAQQRWKFFSTSEVPKSVMEAYLGKSVQNYFKRGDQNPVRYVDGMKK